MKRKTVIVCISMVMFVCKCFATDFNITQIEKEYSALAAEEKATFKGTTFAGRRPFVSHPKLTPEYIQALSKFFQAEKTTVNEAKLWFRTNGIPVGFHSYHGCTSIRTVGGFIRSRYFSLMQKLDSSTWLIFFFGGQDMRTGVTNDHFNEAYLIRKEEMIKPSEFLNERWIEEGVLKETQSIKNEVEQPTSPYSEPAARPPQR
jgi:hypothetical protein